MDMTVEGKPPAGLGHMPARAPWQEVIGHLQGFRDAAHEMGGPDRVERLQHGRGKLSARQRLDALFDEGTFREIGTLVGMFPDHGEPIAPGDGIVAGWGLIDGRPVLAGSEDFTVLGGSIGEGSMAKRVRLCQLAAQEGAPLVLMLDGAGHRLTSMAWRREINDLGLLADLVGVVPVVSLVLGSSAGHGALSVPLSDFTAMTESSALFAAGPLIVRSALGEVTTKEELGGPAVSVVAAGTVHNVATDDAAAIAMARRFLSYLPSNRAATPHLLKNRDMGPRVIGDMVDIVPFDNRCAYSMHAVLHRVFDAQSIFELQPTYGSALITALATLGGVPVGVVANDPAVAAGALSASAAIKGRRFLQTMGAFGLPVVFLADNPGVLAGSDSEAESILNRAGEMYLAQRRLRGPKLHVTLRKAFGFGSSTMAQNAFDHQTISYAFPGVTMGALPATAGAQASNYDDASRATAIEIEKRAGWGTAHALTYDDIIEPSQLRNALLSGLTLAQNRVGNAQPWARGPHRSD